MDAAALAVVGRIVICLVLVVVGYTAIRYGYKLFIAGVGETKSDGRLSLKNPQFKIEVVSSSVGGFLMLTSLGWAFVSYLALPKYAATGGTVEVAAFDTLIKTVPVSASATLDTATEQAIKEFAAAAKKKIAEQPGAGIAVFTAASNVQPPYYAQSDEKILAVLRKAGIDPKNLPQMKPASYNRFVAEFKKSDYLNSIIADNKAALVVVPPQALQPN